MNPEIESWLDFVKNNNNNKNKKRKRSIESDDIDSDIIINELNNMALEGLEIITEEYDLKGRKLTNLLNVVEETFRGCKEGIGQTSDNVDEEFNLLLMAYSSVVIDLIQDLKLEIYTQGSNFDVKEYFVNKKAEFETPRNKKIKITPINIAFSDDDNVVYKEEYNSEEDEEYGSDDSEEVEEGEVDEYENDSEYTSSDNSEEDDSNEVNNEKLLNKKFMAEFNKSLSNNKNPKDETMSYFCSLDTNKKMELSHQLESINNSLENKKPILFKILSLPINIDNKKNLINTFTSIATSLGDNTKIKNLLDNILKIPFGIYNGINVRGMKPKKIKKFLDSLRIEMDNAVWGHDNAKNQILQVMSQTVRNPESKGSVLGIWGPPGNGKTTLIKEGIAKAMKKPFVFISLGGATDASFLEGHSFTYEGSIYGRIARGIIESKCMDPIIYFDELDKVSCTQKGEEIINLLVHLIDSSQNSRFRDKYFHDLDIDLSRVTFIFSFNDPSRVNYILMDRITTIETKNLTVEQKLNIADNYLLPAILRDIGLDDNSIVFDNDTYLHLINNYTNEGGVRKLKKLLYEISREINMMNLTNQKYNNKKINFPFNVNLEYTERILENHYKCNHDMIHNQNSIGIVNGLWANCLGQGGILPIESMLIPTNTFMSIKATGSLEKVIKESIDVALSVAWNSLDDSVKNEWLSKWKDKPECFHIHCPDGAVSKDGPSAGAAITLVLYSRLMNKPILNNIAMTGEINLRGKVTKIGGLEEKLMGAKRAGVQLALIPEENKDDLKIILKRNQNLFDNNFKVISIDNFDDVLKYSFA